MNLRFKFKLTIPKKRSGQQIPKAWARSLSDSTFPICKPSASEGFQWFFSDGYVCNNGKMLRCWSLLIIRQRNILTVHSTKNIFEPQLSSKLFLKNKIVQLPFPKKARWNLCKIAQNWANLANLAVFVVQLTKLYMTGKKWWLFRVAAPVILGGSETKMP